MAFKTTNNIKKRLGQRTHIPAEEKTGVYKLECDDCDKFYIGQTGRPSAERFKEHLPKSDISKTRSSYAQHLMLLVVRVKREVDRDSVRVRKSRIVLGTYWVEAEQRGSRRRKDWVI